MKYLLLLLTAAFAFGQEKTDEAIALEAIKPVIAAVIAGDYKVSIDAMYGPMVEDAGGKEELLKQTELIMKQVDIRFLTYTIVEDAVKIVRGVERKYAVLPSELVLGTAAGQIKVWGFQFGVEVAPKTWQFVDGAGLSNLVLEEYFKDFPADYELPQPRQELVEQGTK